MAMQKRAVGQESDVGSPVYSVAPGRTCSGGDQTDPFQVRTDPERSAATQNVDVGQEMASRPPLGSMVTGADQAPPGAPMTAIRPLTTQQRAVVGQDRAVPTEPLGSWAAHGSFCAHDAPSQERTAVPTTAVHDDVDGHERPTVPGW
jgi:hypothetical protein